MSTNQWIYMTINWKKNKHKMIVYLYSRIFMAKQNWVWGYDSPDLGRIGHMGCPGCLKRHLPCSTSARCVGSVRPGSQVGAFRRTDSPRVGGCLNGQLFVEMDDDWGSPILGNFHWWFWENLNVKSSQWMGDHMLELQWPTWLILLKLLLARDITNWSKAPSKQ